MTKLPDLTVPLGVYFVTVLKKNAEIIFLGLMMDLYYPLSKGASTYFADSNALKVGILLIFFMITTITFPMYACI
jgi:hypothetical protein